MNLSFIRARFDGYQQLDRIEHVRYIVVSGSAVANQIFVLTDATWKTLHQYKLWRARVQRYIVIVDIDVALYCFRFEQVSAR